MDSTTQNVTDSTDDACMYMGTDFLSVKIYLIGVFAVCIAVLSIVLNSFFTVVFIRTPHLRQTPIFYFGILAVVDIVMAFNYIALMAVPVYMDEFSLLWLYHIFLSYLRVVMAESCCAMFSSMLLIILATTERLLRTFNSPHCVLLRKYLERNRPYVCVLCVLIAIAYKFCVYFEIHYVERPNCTDFAFYEIQATSLAQNRLYNFLWMFVTRNVVDRILPFFVLVAMNFLIISTLKREHVKQSTIRDGSKPVDCVATRSTLRDATRVLVSVVTMYLMSQSLQVLITFWEAFHRKSLEESYEFYSYLNDVMSIMTLLSSCLRFPVYCACNKPIKSASAVTLKHLTSLACRRASEKDEKLGDVAIAVSQDGSNHRHYPAKYTALTSSERTPPNGRSPKHERPRIRQWNL